MAIQVVSFRCVLKDQLGRVISSTFNQNVLADREVNQETLSALVDELRDLQKGEKRKICLRADQAYGFYNPSLVLVRRLDELCLPESIKLGERVVYDSDGKRGSYRVTEISADTVTLDGNHPLAGQDLIFEIEATEARDATAEELDATRSIGRMCLLH